MIVLLSKLFEQGGLEDLHCGIYLQVRRAYFDAGRNLNGY
jgi:hypothetical protein